MQTNGIQLLIYTLLGPETRYLRQGVQHQGSPFKQSYFNFKRIDPTPIRFSDFVHPLSFFRYPSVVIPAVSYSMIFLFGSVMITVEIPQLFGEKFHFNTQQLGLQFIAMIIGSVIGEQIGGFMSDRWMARRSNKIQRSPEPEYRLWLSYCGFILTIVGVVVFLVQIQRAPALHWNVTPMIGGAIASAGNQIVTTVMVTYAVDCYREEAGSVGVFITFVRQIWGFIGPFWYVSVPCWSIFETNTDRAHRFPSMFTNVGLYGSAGIAAGLMIAFSILPTIFLQFKGRSLRRAV